uniref:Helicase/UvrB N-terminal domain-containing protein n=1 Tax=Cannabis sativa TaxID=3483 RepID=A0A803PMF5_CANSA
MLPVNVPLRDYQLAITKKALFSNTLVALPTGLGKTLIAAVVMYNYFRWFPDDISVEQLFSFREAQFLYRLSDEHVADLFREHTRKLIEKHISSARTLLKSKIRAMYTLLNT